MRRANKEVTDREEIHAIIRTARVLYLGLSDGGAPYVVPLNFGFDGRFIYFHCAHEGRKLDILAQNSRVCATFVADDEVVAGPRACKWTSRFRSVMAFGTAETVSGSDEKLRALETIMAQYSDGRHQFEPREVDGVTIVKITIERLSAKKSGW